MKDYKINVNGEDHQVSVDQDTPLLWVLRDHLELVGTKFGCGIAQCGACTIHLDGEPARSCSLPISLVKNKAVITIEGLSKEGDHPLQQAWIKHDVPQCGYCQSGQIMTAAAFLKETPAPSIEEIKEAMHNNLCRCGSYLKIQEAVKTASKS